MQTLLTLHGFQDRNPNTHSYACMRSTLSTKPSLCLTLTDSDSALTIFVFAQFPRTCGSAPSVLSWPKEEWKMTKPWFRTQLRVGSVLLAEVCHCVTEDLINHVVLTWKVPHRGRVWSQKVVKKVESIMASWDHPSEGIDQRQKSPSAISPTWLSDLKLKGKANWEWELVEAATQQCRESGRVGAEHWRCNSKGSAACFHVPEDPC